CMGNICRSPAAEAVLRRWVQENGFEEEVEIDSAGTIRYHEGNPPDARMRSAGDARGLTIDGFARQVRRQDLETFDRVIALDRENLADLEELAGGPRPHLRLLSSYLPAGSPADVPDPYWGGERGFEEVLNLLEEAVPALAEDLLSARRA
ncbi:MAG: low molecular weight phosphotyrosine protein phosphatase, partial [Acidobacteria bacterium]|nr:low molecular weight phosphotyrosine protein phosphatase [Acidobacteriota bacterium]